MVAAGLVAALPVDVVPALSAQQAKFGGTLSLTQQLQSNIVKGAIGARISTAVAGGDLDSALLASLQSAGVNEVLGATQSAIDDLTDGIGDAILEAEVVVLNKDIGFVREGLPVEVKLETFPFTRYGLVHGVVKEVWHDAIQDEKQGLVYKAVVSLQEKRILVNDRWQPLTPGMSVQAEIKTGDRRVIDYFLSPLLRYRDESLRER